MSDACIVPNGNDPFDMNLHIGAVYIIFGLSMTGVALPIIAKQALTSATGKVVITMAKLFGVGVIMATGFVHMLIPAVTTLNNPCLPEPFSVFKGMAGVVAIAGAFMIHLFQLLTVRMIDAEKYRQSIESEKLTIESGVEITDEGHSHDEDHAHSVLMSLSEQQVSAYLLELGVMSHSVIIGLTLGITTGREFTSLLIALSFHQFFEGLALSSLVVEAEFAKKTTAIVMCALYSITTPVGIGIGIAVHEWFSATSTNSLISQGLLDSFSAGILIYDALVNVIAPHFKSKTFAKANSTYAGMQLLIMYIGAGVMSLIGLWA